MSSVATSPTNVALAPRLLLSVDEVCAALHMSRAHIYRLLASGELPSVKVGRCRRVLFSALEAYCARLAAAEGGGGDHAGWTH